MHTFKRNLTKARESRQDFEYRKSSRPDTFDARFAAREWIDAYISDYAEFLPHKTIARLPPGSVTFLFRKYQYDLSQLSESGKILGRSAFLKIFSEEYSQYVTFMKKSNFAKCDICDKYSSLRQKVAGEIRLLMDQQHIDGHMADMFKENATYTDHKREALDHPERVISLVVDGMDQKKTSVPHRSVESHATSACDRMDVPIIGVISHGHKPGSLAYYTHGEFSKDSSLTAQVVLSAIKRVRDALPAGMDPRKLYLQMDNCARENKNRTIMTLMELLIRHGMFDEVLPLTN
jgi:hypothetical protein